MFNQDGARTSPEIILAQYYSKDNTNGAGTLMQEMLPNQSNKRLEDYGDVRSSIRTWCLNAGWNTHLPRIWWTII